MARFNLKGTIQLDGSQWNAGLEQMKGKANRWSADVSNMVRSRLMRAFAAVALIRGVDQKTARAGQIRDESNALGMDIETFQKADFAAQQSAASIDDVAKATKRLAVSSIDALRGSKDVLEAYQRFGITAEMLSNLKSEPGDLLFLLADLVQKGVNPTDLGDIQKIAGRSAGNLLPAFRAGFAESGRDAVDRGVIIPEHQVRELAAAGDEITTQKAFVDKILTGATFNALKTVTELGEVASIDRDTAKLVFENAKKSVELLEKINRNTSSTEENTRPLNQ